MATGVQQTHRFHSLTLFVDLFWRNQGVFQSFILGNGSFYDISTCDIFALFCTNCHVSVNTRSVDLVDASFFLYFRHILLNFWIVKDNFAFEKQINMSVVKSVFYFLTDFILGPQIMICPKLVHRRHNWPEISPGNDLDVLGVEGVVWRCSVKKVCLKTSQNSH